MAVAQSMLEKELERAGIRLSIDEFQMLVLEAVRQFPAPVISDDPVRELTEIERDALLRSGGVLEDAARDGPNARERSAAKFAALLATSYKVDDVANMLGVDPSRVRQRLKERSLYGVKTREGWRLPRFQFDGRRTIPGVEQVIAALPIDIDLLGFYNWFTLPDPEFWVNDVSVSPSDWLLQGGDPGKVAALAASFKYAL
jgi:hypothetical protein